jgi:uncharacterized phage protein (TIGR02218 family)
MHEIRNIQSPYTETDFWNQWGSVNPRMSLFILVTPKSFWTGVSPVGFTSNTRDMTLPGHPGVTFHSTPAITPTQVEQSLGVAGNLEMTGLYQSSIFERGDVIAGKWNFATVEVFSACWDNTDLGELVHFKGNLGEFKDYESYFTGEGRGFIDRLTNDVNKVTQRSCRVKDFGDAECGKDLSGTVTIDGTPYDLQIDVQPDGSFDNQDTLLVFLGSGIDQPENFFANGKMIANDGANAGISREIAYSSAGIGATIQLQLKRPFPFPFAGTESITLVAGCRRTIEDCRKYNNAVNFRGEPYLPGIESANRISSGN